MGSDGRTRTGDTTIMSRLLYRLSYTAIHMRGNAAVVVPALWFFSLRVPSRSHTGNPASPLTESNR